MTGPRNDVITHLDDRLSFIIYLELLTFVLTEWGDHIKWMCLSEARDAALRDNKPLMHIVHKPNCLSSRHLRKQFSVCAEIEVLTHYFVMVNQHASDTDTFNKLDPRDYPHIKFYHPNGHLMPEITSHPRAQFKYSYVNFDSLVGSMIKVLLTLESDQNMEKLALLEF